MSLLLGGALTAGLLGSPHCVGMCGPFVAATGRSAPAWHAGRLATYATLGAVGGAAGSASFLGGTGAAVVSAVLLVLFAARLAGWAPSLPIRWSGLTDLGARLLRRGGLAAHFGFGVVSGLLPCGLVWSALALAVAAGSPTSGALVMAAFFAGTLPALALASAALRRLTTARPWTRRLVAAAVLAAGLGSVTARALTRPEAPACHVEP